MNGQFLFCFCYQAGTKWCILFSFPGDGGISSTFLGTLISIRNKFVISFRRLHCQPGWGTMIIFCINATRHYLTFLSSCHWFVMTMVVEIRRKMMRNEIKLIISCNNWNLLWSWKEWLVLIWNQKHSRPIGGLAFSTLKLWVLNYV